MLVHVCPSKIWSNEWTEIESEMIKCAKEALPSYSSYFTEGTMMSLVGDHTPEQCWVCTVFMAIEVTTKDIY